MDESLYPKLNRIGVVEAPWGDEVPKSPSKWIKGLIGSPDDPALIWVICLVDAAFNLSITSLHQATGIFVQTAPCELAEAAGRELTLNEYLNELERLGFNLTELRILAEDGYARHLVHTDGIQQTAGDAAAFFQLLKDEHFVSTEQIHKYLHESSIYKFLELVLANADTVRAKLNASKRHLPKNIARDFVQYEWRLHKDSYALNKSAFARDYSRRVKNELGTDVTEKTIREVWLSDTPTASKHAG